MDIWSTVCWTTLGQLTPAICPLPPTPDLPTPRLSRICREGGRECGLKSEIIKAECPSFMSTFFLIFRKLKNVETNP